MVLRWRKLYWIYHWIMHQMFDWLHFIPNSSPLQLSLSCKIWALTYLWIVHEVVTGCWWHPQPTWRPSPAGPCHGSEVRKIDHPILCHGGRPTPLKYCTITHLLIAIGTWTALDTWLFFDPSLWKDVTMNFMINFWEKREWMYANHFLLIVSCLNMLEMDENSLPVQTKSISHIHAFNQSILMEVQD